MPLPTALIFLLCVAGVFADNFSINDPFRTFSIHVSRRQKHPICCLKPLVPMELVEDQVLLSFEEWKAKHSALQEQQLARTRDGQAAGMNGSGQDQAGSDTRGKNGDGAPFVVNYSSQSSSPQALSTDYIVSQQSPEVLSPHFRVPLTDRFNYASLDCSARIHASHRSAKSPSSVLSSKRDRYMLSPCKRADGEKQFIVVELCEDIRIDTVQLANFEFFSGVFKDFSVRVAKTYTTDDEGWVDAGSYRGKNVRGVQSFHPPTSLRDFYRYIRIDFHTHYGNEYYCPVSLLRVYGLTHLEEWKWEMWEAESRARMENTGLPNGREKTHETPGIPIEPDPTSSSTSTHAKSEASDPHELTSASSMVVMDSQQVYQTTAFPSPDSSRVDAQSVGLDIPSVDITQNNQTIQSPPTTQHDSDPQLTTALNLTPWDTNASAPSNTLVNLHPHSDTPSNGSLGQSTTHTNTFITSFTLHTATQTTIQTFVSHTPSPVVHSSVHAAPHSSVVAYSAVPPPVVPAASGESIYRLIMNRLTALETNYTLYTRYVEQQNTAVRELLKRLGEDVGRLEGIGRAQSQAYQRTVQEWERQRGQMQVEYRELLTMVEYLSDEIMLEKRLGIAQLCLLLAVLVFMALTRGSRGEPIIRRDTQAKQQSKYTYMREWSRRHLSLSTDLAKPIAETASTADVFRSKDSKMEAQRPNGSSFTDHDEITVPHLNGQFMFPHRRGALTAIDLNAPPSPTPSPIKKSDSRSRKVSDPTSRSRTPSFRTSAKRIAQHNQHLNQHIYQQYYTHHRALTPTKSGIRRPPLQRSNSHSTEAYLNGTLLSAGALPRSAKRWARSAHLHEVRTMHPVKFQNENENQQPRTADVPEHHREQYEFPPWSTNKSTETPEVKGGKGIDQGLDPQSHVAEVREGHGNSSSDDGASDGDQWEDTDSIGDGFDS
ncbi:hypothetical protein AMATHDRAFT_805 [Amanita thiersii Skay4041]|uniref:SUN domain-containing protein n=1 Tax=Amanita thiersii Skay4041 TaxID=703135 RepID=A0A2A9P0H6_9AGAR|nr:hypothetical protein AMATHDRAFT_805 [Amanita thiersii Skay4041]